METWSPGSPSRIDRQGRYLPSCLLYEDAGIDCSSFKVYSICVFCLARKRVDKIHVNGSRLGSKNTTKTGQEGVNNR